MRRVRENDRKAKEGEEILLRTALEGIEERVEPGAIDKIWIFPPQRNGEFESIVIVTTTFAPEDQRRRTILTANCTLRYEETRRGTRTTITKKEIEEQGSAPAERIDRVVAGVMRRLDDELASLPPHLITIGGDLERWKELHPESHSPGTTCAPAGV